MQIPHITTLRQVISKLLAVRDVPALEAYWPPLMEVAQAAEALLPAELTTLFDRMSAELAARQARIRTLELRVAAEANSGTTTLLDEMLGMLDPFRAVAVGQVPPVEPAPTTLKRLLKELVELRVRVRTLTVESADSEPLRALMSLASTCYQTAKSKGWWEEGPRPVPETLALMHSELSEALEAYRMPNGQGMATRLDPLNGKPEGYWTELADVIIRILDVAGHHDNGVELVAAMKLKMGYNATRPYRHGGKVC